MLFFELKPKSVTCKARENSVARVLVTMYEDLHEYRIDQFYFADCFSREYFLISNLDGRCLQRTNERENDEGRDVVFIHLVQIIQRID